MNNVASSITSIKSIDVMSQTYQTGQRLYSTIMNYATKLSRYPIGNGNKLNFIVNHTTQKILEVYISPGATRSQLQQINRAIADAAQKGIQIIVKTFNKCS